MLDPKFKLTFFDSCNITFYKELLISEVETLLLEDAATISNEMPMPSVQLDQEDPFEKFVNYSKHSQPYASTSTNVVTTSPPALDEKLKALNVKYII